MDNYNVWRNTTASAWEHFDSVISSLVKSPLPLPLWSDDISYRIFL